MMLGVLITSIGSGQAITRIGRYKAFPVVGTAVMSLGLFLLSHLGVGTSTARRLAVPARARAGARDGDAGAGPRRAERRALRVLGAATSGVTLMRGVGGSVGTAVFGSLFTHELTAQLNGGGCRRSCGRSWPAAGG